MSLQLLQSYHAIAPGNLQVSVGAIGGTPPYIFSVVPGGAGGTIGSDTGIYTSPLTNTGEDELMVTDSSSSPLVATGSMLVCTPLELVCDIIQTSMGLSQGQVYLWDQKINIPTDSRLYVIVGIQNCKPFANRPRFVGGSSSFLAEQTVNMLATLTIDILSRGPAARDQKELVLLAMSGPYSLQQQELNSFYLATLPTSMVNLSHIDGAAIPYRFQILANLQYFTKRVTNPGYFNTFGSIEVITDPPQHEPPPVNVIFQDDFDGADNTLLQAHVPGPVNTPGNAWDNAGSGGSGDFEIEGNVCVGVAGVTDPLYKIDLETSVGTWTVTCIFDTSDAQLGVYFGGQTIVYSSPGYALTVTPGGWSIQQYGLGGGVLMSDTYPFVTGTTYEFQLVLDAMQNISFYLDGVLMASAVGTATPGNFWGIEAYHPAGGGPPLTQFLEAKLTVP